MTKQNVAHARDGSNEHPLLVRKAGSDGPWTNLTPKGKLMSKSKVRAILRGLLAARPAQAPVPAPRSAPRAPRAPRPRSAPTSSATRVDSDDGDGPPPPLLVNQRTALAVLGLTRRAFLALVKSHSIPHRVFRRLTLCRLDDVLRALGLAPAAAPAAPPVPWQERARLQLIAGGRHG
jgi:hypothetical protein